MKLAYVLMLSVGCTGGENIGYTPLLGPQHWTIGLGGNSIDAPAVDGVAFAPDGNIVVTGIFRNTADFGNGPRTAANQLGSIFISKRSIVDGSELWTDVIGAAGDTGIWVTGAKVDSSGNVVIAGREGVDEDFGGITLPVADGQGFVAKYDGTGHLLWARSLGGTGGALEGDTLAISSDDSITVAGVSQSNMYSLPFHPAQTDPGWIVHLAPDGTPLWDATTPTQIDRIAALSDGSIGIATSIDQTMTYAGHSLVAQSGRTPVVAHASATGTIDRAATYGEPNVVYWGPSVVATGDGFATATSAWPNDDEMVSRPHVTGVDSHGSIAWSAEAASGPAEPYAIAAAPSGALLVGGRMFYAADFGNGTIHGATYIASYAPDGSFLDARAYGAATNDGNDAIRGVAISSSGDVAFVGVLADQLDFGTGLVTTHGDFDVVVGLISPPTH